MTILSDPLSGIALTASAETPTIGLNLGWVVIGACCALLAAAGVWLVHGSKQPAGKDNGTHLLCISLAGVAFFATGFALAMGGVSGSYGGLGPLTGLGREWIPYGEGRGILGLEGFFLSGAAYDAGVYALFLFQAACALLASVIALASWVGRAPRLVAVLFSIVFGGALYPIFTNWVWGGGWLANLGQTRALGHGVVDFAGSGVVNAMAGLTALGAFLGLRPPARETPDHALGESLAVAGLGLAAIGWIGLSAANTFALTDTRLAIAATNVLVAVVCAAAVGLLYTWFAGGEPDALIGTQAGVAGMAAIAAGAPFFPAWAAAVVGGVAGLLVPFAGYILERLLRVRGPALLVAAHGVAGLWGLLAVGLMADGRYGMGWNGIGQRAYLGIAGQGVTGLYPAGPTPADPTQLTAQLAGIAVLLALPIVSWLFVRIGRWAVRG